MIGIMIGAAAVLGTAFVLRRAHWRRYGHRRGCGHAYYGHYQGRHGGWQGDCQGKGHGYGDARGWNDPHDEGPFGDHDPHERGRGWGRARFGGWGPDAVDRWAGMLAWRLDATREQAQVIRDAFRSVHDELHSLREEGRSTRDDVAKALAGERFDEELLGLLFARHDERLESLRRTLVGALAKVHDALSPEQRERLARLIGRRFGFGYRI